MQNQKKPTSRKSRCLSVKQTSNYQPIKFKNLMQQFKELKLLQEK
jgi:hypothetical protein